MDTDERFKHLASDPRFKAIKKKQRKVQIDERFQSMFTDEKFTLKYKQDKRGNRHKKTSGDDLKKYYSLEKGEPFKKKIKEDDHQGEEDEDEDEEEEDQHQVELEASDDEEEENNQVGAEQEDEEDESGDDEENDDEEAEDNDLTDASQVSSSSDESESEDEAALEEDLIKLRYDWQPLDHDAERADNVTTRLAIQNLDWNSLDIRDIYVLLNSIRPPLNVRLYISEFGKERLAKEEIDGPQELADMPQLDEDEEELNRLESRMKAFQNKDSKSGIAAGRSSYKADEYEDADEAIDWKNEEIRERLRRYQLSQMKYYYAIAKFDSPESAQAVYKELDGIEYEGSSLELDLRFVPDEVEFDAADMKAECDQVPDLATYKAPQFINTALQQTTVKFTWDETDVKRQHKLRKAYTKEELEKDDLEAYLASETDSDDERGDDKYKDLLMELHAKEEEKKKVDVDVRWNDDDDNDDDDDDDDQDDAEEEPDAGLDLLVMDSDKQENFRFDPDDDRFKAVYESGLYNIDPSHPNFKRTEAFNQIAEKKREKRRKFK